MTMHRTNSGYVTFLAQWGHGKGRPISRKQPATVFTNDGDGHYQAWSYTGKQIDALVSLARLERQLFSQNLVALRDAPNSYTLVDPPADFWIDDPENIGCVVPNSAAYPDIIAW